MIVVVFHTTAEAFECERACQRARVEGRLTTIPRQITASCGLAWRSEDEHEAALRNALQEAAVDYEGIYQL